MILCDDLSPPIYQCTCCWLIHSFTSSALQAVMRAEILMGFGKVPDATRLHKVADEKGRHCISCFCLTKPVLGMLPKWTKFKMMFSILLIVNEMQ